MSDPNGARDGSGTAFKDSQRLYSKIAADYDESYTRPGARLAYDTLASELIDQLLPAAGGHLIDVGCGTGRTAARLLDRGHTVTGIERAPGMLAMLASRGLGSGFGLVEADMETAALPAGAADLVIAQGSLPYSHDPDLSLRNFVSWTRPGGAVALYADSLTSLVSELLRDGRSDEAMTILRTRRGTFRAAETEASVHLFTSVDLVARMLAAGLVDVACRGLCVSAGFMRRDEIAAAMERDAAAFLARERELAGEPAFTDRGLHLFASGRRPAVLASAERRLNVALPRTPPGAALLPLRRGARSPWPASAPTVRSRPRSWSCSAAPEPFGS